MDPHPRYQLLEKIASGSFATVYRGRDNELGRDVAVKQIHEQYLADQGQLDRYWQEAQILASFQHPNIVTIYDIVRDRGWLIMELMQSDLSKVAGRKQMDLGALRTTLAHCLRALKFLHAHGIVHGDVKPSNMMIDRRRRVKLGDFGLARRVSDEEGSLIKGTTKYMAPEVVSDEFGEVGPASDLYSLGFAAFELMCGENFESLFPGLNAFGRDRQMAWMMWHAAPDRRLPEISRVLADVPEDLTLAIGKLTAKSQAERFKSADEALSVLSVDLKIVKTGEESSEGLKPPSAGDAAGRKRLILVAGAFAVSLVLSLAVLFMPGGTSHTSVEKEPARTGIVRSVNVEQGILTIEDEQGFPEDVSVGKNPRIRLNEGDYILLRQLEPRDRVAIRIPTGYGEKFSSTISALRPTTSQGELKSVDAEASKFVASIAGDPHPQDVPMFVPSGAKLFLNGQTAKVGDLQPRDRVEISHIKDTAGRAARDVILLEARRTVQVAGFVKQVKPQGDKLWLVLDQLGTESLFEFGTDCRITINGEATGSNGPFAPHDLQPGDRVQVAHDTHVTAVDAIRRARHLGIVLSVNPPAREIQIRTDEGQELTLAVADDCEISISGKPGKLDQLEKFFKIEITYDPGDGVPASARTIDARPPRS